MLAHRVPVQHLPRHPLAVLAVGCGAFQKLRGRYRVAGQVNEHLGVKNDFAVAHGPYPMVTVLPPLVLSLTA